MSWRRKLDIFALLYNICMSYLQQCINVSYCILCSCWETVRGHCSYLPPSSCPGAAPGIREGGCVLHSLGVQYQTSSLQTVCGDEMVGRRVTWNHFQVGVMLFLRISTSASQTDYRPFCIYDLFYEPHFLGCKPTWSRPGCWKPCGGVVSDPWIKALCSVLGLVLYLQPQRDYAKCTCVYIQPTVPVLKAGHLSILSIL